MWDCDHGYRRTGWLALLFCIALIGCARPTAGFASEIPIGSAQCHAVAATPPADDRLPARFACRGTPRGYQHGSLWLRIDLRRQPINPNDLVLTVHDSRFDRLAVAFLYADGAIVRRQVRSGDFGAHWRAGGQIAFPAPKRATPPVALVLRFDRLASAEILRIRLLDTAESERQATAMAATVGAALMLLLIGALYNASLAVAVRRGFPLWQAAWAGCMALWGALWSQLPLFFLPWLAGSLTSQICTGLACLAVMLATLSAVTAIEPRDLPRRLRQATLITGCLIGLLGQPLAAMRTGPLFVLAQAISVLMMLDLLLVTACLVCAWRRGSGEARAFAGAWAFPMMALWIAQFISVDRLFWGGGSQILVLFSAAWQTMWLSVAATRRFALMRIERDRARDAAARAHELARRDPLTGLRNRRGLIEAVAPMLDAPRNGENPIALLILDVDLFKSINDTYGHEAGDQVLCAIARRLERWDGPFCVSARLGGEEFALMVGGLDGLALTQFAESVRQGIAACDHGASIGARSVTVSIGGASANRETDYRELYRVADEALYSAKMRGRNRVEIRPVDPEPEEADEAEEALGATPGALLPRPPETAAKPCAALGKA